ncbi:MAG: M13 family metallopeptidase [Bdellovibrionota bacterium]
MKILLLFLVAFTARADEPLPPIMDPAAIKDSVDPCEDFYQYSCGNWLDHTVIPADKSSVSRQVTVAMDSTDVNLNKILASYARGDFTPKATYSAKIRDFYTTCLNSEKLAPAATTAAKKRAAALRTYSSKAQFAAQIANMHLAGAGPLFGFGSAQDLDDSTKVIGDLGQGGIALGQRDYYLASDDKGREILAKYKEHISKIFELLGETNPDAADTILRIETELAKASYNLADQGNPSKTHHVMSTEDLTKLAPHFDWATYFKTIGNKYTKHMNVEEPEFFAALDHVLAATKKADLDTYLEWQFIHSISSRIGGPFEKEDFRFWSAYLAGAKEMMPRWKICTRAVEGSLGYALSEAYVQTFDGKSIKAKTEEMINEIKATFTSDLGELSWMDSATAAKAIEKVAAISQKVGGPEKWRDYHTLKTNSASYFENSLAVNRFESIRDVNKIGKPVDRTEWGMMPWEINAYYDRSLNEFNFPFGILQPPSLDLHATNGANLGSFGGGTIGHEMTHGFDNNGSQYDNKGNVKNWWSDTTLNQFLAKSACYVDQANQYKINLVGLNVNGKNTLEENLADQGGVKLGYAALDKELASRPEGAPWGKFNERQQFWIAYAQSWCEQITAEHLRERMTTNVHPPAEFRVNAVIMNRPEFAADFSCKAGAKMAPVNRCSLW